MNTVFSLILIIFFERTNSKDLLLTLADEKKTIKKVTIDEKNKDKNNRDVEPKQERTHSDLDQSEDTTINFPPPESGAALETIGQDYNNDATENRSSLKPRKRVRVANRCRPKKNSGLKFECRYKTGSR